MVDRRTQLNILGGVVVFGAGILSTLFSVFKSIQSEPIDIAGIIMHSIFTLVLLSILIVQIQLNRLLYYFTKKYPKVAAKEVPENGPPGRLLYFLRGESSALIEQDEKLRQMKRHIIAFFIIALPLPASIMLCVGAVLILRLLLHYG
jgi:hypothetical protein